MFTERSTVEKRLPDLLCGGPVGRGFARRGGTIGGTGWHDVDAARVPLVEDWIRNGLLRLKRCADLRKGP
jgi:hypothetical protein